MNESMYLCLRWQSGIHNPVPYKAVFFDQKKKIWEARDGNWRGAAPQSTQTEKCTREAVKKEVLGT